MKIKMTAGERTFTVVNYTILAILALLCLMPFFHLIALSFSSADAATSGTVTFIPIDFTTIAYQDAFKMEFVRAFKNSVIRVVLGVCIQLLLVIITAYPLSKTKDQLPGRGVVSWFFIITMLVGGGLIPAYLVAVSTHIINTIWALILPGAISAYNLTIVMNFFRTIPKGLEESALIDGASQLTILFKIYVPLSKPIIATMVVFFTVGHWNEWFNAMIYMNDATKYPLMTYLRTILITPNYDDMQNDELEKWAQLSQKSVQAAQILIATLPILVIYPICQKYFVKGMTLGSLKG